MVLHLPAFVISDSRLKAYLLDNGRTYHIANAVAVTEYIATSWYNPKYKAYPYVTEIGAHNQLPAHRHDVDYFL